MPDQTSPKPPTKPWKALGLAALLFFLAVFVIFPIIRNT
jgi:hypothetical protein